MRRFFRWLRAAAGMGALWGFAWFMAGMGLLLVVGPDAADVPFPLGFGLLGFLAGVTFSGVLSLVERNRSFDQISIPRFALWGGLGGTLFAGGFVTLAGLGLDVLAVLGPVFGVAGAACASGTLALARRGEDAGALSSGEAVESAGLTDTEARELLGPR